MGSHPVNLAVRFALEVVTLIAVGYWGWTQHDGIWRFVWAFGLPLLLMVFWGAFAVPNDPSRSGSAPVPIAGLLRLILELSFFAIGTWGLFAADLTGWGTIMGIVVLIHYALSYDRISWLLSR